MTMLQLRATECGVAGTGGTAANAEVAARGERPFQARARPTAWHATGDYWPPLVENTKIHFD